MEALRKIIEVNNNNQLNFKLPDNFNFKFVEIIVLPAYEFTNQENKENSEEETTDFQKFLLSAPIMTDNDYEYFLSKKNDFNKWN